MTEETEKALLTGRRATYVGVLLAEMMVLGPMIALLPSWMAAWEPRFVGLLMMAAAAPIVTLLLDSPTRARVAEAIADADRRRRDTLPEIATHRDLVPEPTKPAEPKP